MSNNVENIFLDIPKFLEEELFQQIIESPHISIERIISKGHTSPDIGWYDQEKNEWVIILKGKAVVSFLHESSVTLSKGDYITIPAHKKHRVDWTDPDIETIWLAIHYD